MHLEPMRRPAGTILAIMLANLFKCLGHGVLLRLGKNVSKHVNTPSKFYLCLPCKEYAMPIKMLDRRYCEHWPGQVIPLGLERYKR